MKKITLALALLFGAHFADAQVLATENFDAGITWTVTHVSGTSTNVGWTGVTSGTNPTCLPVQGSGMAQFDSFNIAAGNTYSLRSPGIEFSGASYRIKFNMYRDGGYPSDNDRVRVYYNTTTAAGGTLLGTISRSISLPPAVPETGWNSYAFNLPANVTGTGYVSLIATSAYGNRIFVDNITVSQIQENDAEMSTLAIANIAAAGNIPITGNFKNLGSNNIDSVDLNWQVDNGEIHTATLTGLALVPGGTYTYNHPDAWSAGPGQFSVKVWTSNPNGSTDSDATNDEVTKTISIASGSVTRLPLYEKFSSSTCNPCGLFNGTYFNPFYTSSGEDFAFISYQVNWPGAGDPYYTEDVHQRVLYYSVNAAPTLFVDSVDGTNFDTTALQNDLNTAESRPAFFALAARHSIVGNNINVDVDVTPYLTGDFTVHAVVVEHNTYDNATSNGETEFHNVTMKMIPGPAGTPMTFAHDVPQSISLSASLTGTNIEEMTDLRVVVFVQNNADRSIMQAAYSEQLLANAQFDAAATVKLFPNPTSGIVRLSSATPVDVVVSDLTGKVVLTQNAVSSNGTLDLSAFQAGVYMAKITSNGAVQTQKIILK